MNINDVDLEFDYIYCNSSKNQTAIPISDITKIYLEKYINEDSEEDCKLYGENALFVSSQGKSFTRQGLWKLIKKYCSSYANINKNIKS